MAHFTLNSDFENCRYYEKKQGSGKSHPNFNVLTSTNLPKLTQATEYLSFKNIHLWEAASMVAAESGVSSTNRKIRMGKIGIADSHFYPYHNSNIHNIPDQAHDTDTNTHVQYQLRERGFTTLTFEDSLPVDFCQNTSLHGLKYIGQKRNHILEKIFWTVAFTLAVVIAAWMISAVWQKYKRNPVIVSFQPYETKTNEIPFPAITICNMNKILKSKAEAFIRKSKGPRTLQEVKNAQEYVRFMDHVCTATISFSKRFNYSNARGSVPETLINQILTDKTKSEVDTLDVTKFLEYSSQRCADMVPLCIWQDELTNCTELFTYENTDYGKCCTFNMMPKQLLYRSYSKGEDNSSDELQDWKAWEWDGDNLITKNQEIIGDFPRRQKLPGKTFGLSILLNPDLHEYFCTTSDSIGFRLLAHSPIEVPRVVDFGNAVPPNSEVFIKVKPTITVADDKIQGFTLEQRQCYFSDEYRLNFYAYYTSTNCVMECIANLTFRKCNCAPYYMPRDDSRNLCTRSQFRCAAVIKREMIHEGYNSLCKECRPSCTEIKYLTELTTVPLQDPHMLWESGVFNKPKWSRSNASIVHIYFGDETTTARIRTELYGLTDLLANFGGLMGLCLGFSGLSLIEIFYFLTIRAYCKRRSNKLDPGGTGLNDLKQQKENSSHQNLSVDPL